MLPSPDILNDYPFGKFVLSNLAAKRAKQLKAGAPPLVRIESNHPLTIALAEIAAGKIRPILKDPSLVEAEETTEAIVTDEFGILLPGIEDEEDVLAIEGLVADDDILLDEFGLDDEDHEEAEEPDHAPTLSDLVTDEEDEHEAEATVVEPEVDGTLSLTDLEEEEEPTDEDDDLSV
ncbi:MAG: DNA-directed RNA polymerase subunit omega [Fimbriimonadaceae bacterium]|nr:DNA-directed RNA polymerase subunit omega [Fimbriimonadaceae bacterium]